MQYKSYMLDPFQEQAIRALEKHHSAVVSAPTGTGKTLIADYLINKTVQERQKVIYTSPIKALSNQKYFEFSQSYPGKIGLLTGDVTINRNADVLIMTTEIYRNMLLAHDPQVTRISHVIFDEVHFINDYERGTVWEEALIFSPEHMRFLCLSATIPNAAEFASWIESIKHHPVEVIVHAERAVPLKYFFYDERLQQLTRKTIADVAYRARVDRSSRHMREGRVRDRRTKRDETALERRLLSRLRNDDLLPLLYFSFSRKDTEQLARLAGQVYQNLLGEEEKARVIRLSRELLNGEILQLPSTRMLRELVGKGIAYHHAGLLPKQKELVERAFTEGLIKALFATETFALGINMPTRAVAFHRLRKWDGRNFRSINGKEFLQMAGRAGRRGMDTEGTVIIPLNEQNMRESELFEKLLDPVPEPMLSQYKISYNTVINVVRSLDESATKEILRHSFYAFQQGDERQLERSFKSHQRRLKKLGYIDEDNRSTRKGIMLSRIYTQELLVTEFLYAPSTWELSPIELNLCLAALVYEPKPNVRFYRPKVDDPSLLRKLSRLFEKNAYLAKHLDQTHFRKIFNLVYQWCKGEPFERIMKISSLAEGDLVRFFRQLIDLQEQIIHALSGMQLDDEHDGTDLVRKLRAAKDMVNRSHVLFTLEEEGEAGPDMGRGEER